MSVCFPRTVDGMLSMCKCVSTTECAHSGVSMCLPRTVFISV